MQFLEGDNIFSDRSALADSISQSSSSFDVTPKTPWDQSSRNATVGIQSSSAATSNDHVRWCFICEDPGPITTRDGLKRHVHKHFTKYYCIPSNSVKQTQVGPTCAFCGVSNPDPRHLNRHNSPECIGKIYTTKDNLIDHLGRIHDVRGSSEVAKQAKYTVGPKYFACGFCVFCCDSLNKQVNHVDAAHYKFSAHIRHWDQDTVICGLLSQPILGEYWQGCLAANPHLQEPGLKWNPTHIKNLQRRLELSQEPPAVLCQAAEAAIDYRSHGISQQSFRDHRGDTSQSIQTFHREDTWFPLAYNSEQGPLPCVSSMTAPIPSHNLGMEGLDGSDRETNCEDAPSPVVAFEGCGSPTNSIYRHADHHAQPWASPNFMRRQLPTSVSSLASASGTPRALEGHARISYPSGSRSYLSDRPSNVVTHPWSRQAAATHSYPAQGQTGLPHSLLTTQSVSSPLSRNRGAPSLDHLNSAYSPISRPTFNTQFSREETTDHHSIDMDHEPGSQQRFIQGNHRSQRQRGNR